MKKFIIVALGLFVLPAFMQAADEVASDVSTSDVAVETVADSAPVKEDPAGDDPIVVISKGVDLVLSTSNTSITNVADESGDDTDGGDGDNGNGGDNGGSNNSGGGSGSKKKKTTSETEGLVLGVNTLKFNNNLWQGMRSDEVKELQKRLRAEGFFTFPQDTGYFGPITFAAVQEYQASRGIWTTGFVGMITRAALNR